jgi:transposase-like protein
MKDGIVMSKEQLKVYRLALKVIDGDLKVKDFALLVGLSERQAYRKLSQIREMDYIGALHGNTGNRPINKSDPDFEQQIIYLLKTKYQGFNLTHFREMLMSEENIGVKKTTLQTWAKKHGLEKHSRRSIKKAHKPRPRMPQEGMLVQFDGSPHQWFGDERSTLLLAIDDATGKILSAEFFEWETSFYAMKVIKEVIDTNGIPEAFYFDQAGLYGKVDRDFTSQISRALGMVNCRVHIASSPQAKGRVERVFRTLQDRLVSEMKLRGIWDFYGANDFLKNDFIPRFNAKFGVEAQNPTTAYLTNVFGDLELAFCKKEQRKIGSGNVFSFDGQFWVIEEKISFQHRPVNINTHLDGSMSFDIMGRLVTVKKFARNMKHLKTGT